VLNGETLSADQAWGVALASALFVGQPELSAAVLEDARASGASDELVSDARAAAALMGMNTVYYRFRHLVGKPSYSQMPARLRMSRIAQPQTSKADFELMSLACAALAGCETCVKAHEASVLKHGLTEAHVHDTVRTASVIAGVATALGL